MRLRAVDRYGVRLILFACAVVLAAPFAFLLTQVLTDGPVARWDVTTAQRLADGSRGSPLLVEAMRFMTFLGTPLWLWVVGPVTGAWALVRYRRIVRPILFLAVTPLLGGAINTSVKLAVARPRPTLDALTTAYGYSFPSGHAFHSVVVYGTILLAAGIGISRLALGVHYVSDVVGGWVLGAAWLSASVAAFGVWRQEETGRETDLTRGVEP